MYEDFPMYSRTFQESDKIFPNPERGFYTGADFFSATDKPLTSAKMIANKVNNRTLYYTGYYLTDYMESDIAEEYLDLIRTNMQVLREGGSKCILRFAYKIDMYETGHPWDASPEWVKRHIEQVKPILQEYGDVIFCLQAGFVGVWGEWAYTDNFVQSPETEEDYALRKEVMVYLLEALPTDRQVALRTPMFKRMMFLNSYTDTLTIETAFNGSYISRICGHNDCFGASSSDYGTFTTKETREFWKKDTRYVMMGGETCVVSKYCLCDQSMKDLVDYHWTYLNSGYNSNVHDRWKTDGCFEEIECRLGYRLSLTEVSYTKTPSPDTDFQVVIEMKNTGFSAPVNPRAVELILIDGKGTETVYELKNVDPRYWFVGETIKFEHTFRLPADASGDCNLYLNLPDPKPTLRDNPRFSIRLANKGVWEEEKGYNRIASFTI